MKRFTAKSDPAPFSASSTEEEVCAALSRRFAPFYRISELLQSRDWVHRFADAAGRPRDGERLMRRLAPEAVMDSTAIRERWRDYLDEERRGKSPRRDLHFYVHFPFCKQKCAYCGYHSAPLRDVRDLDAYLRRLSEQLAFYAGAFSGRTLDTLYFGGGTPSILNAAQLERFFAMLYGHYAFDKKGQKTVEFNPVSVSEERLAVLAKYGINRVSMGVQSFESGALSLENRGYQDRRMVAEAFRMIRNFSGLFLNIDLLLGMRGDSKDTFLATLDRAMEMRPDSIVIYPIQATRKYLDAFYEGSVERFGAELAARYEDVAAEVRKLARRRGYRWKRELLLEDVEWIFRCRDSEYEFTTVYSDYAEEPASLFAIGPTSRSRIAGRLFYEEGVSGDVRFDPAERLNAAEILAPLCEETRLVLLSIWRRRAVSRREFRFHFGRDIEEVFPSALRVLRGMRVVLEDGDRIRFTAKSPKSLFEHALRFMDVRGCMDGLFGCEITLEAKGHSLVLRVEDAAEGGEFLDATGRSGLRVVGEIAPLFPGNTYQPMVKLLKSLFRRAAVPGGGPAGMARRLRAALAEAAGRLGLNVR